MNQHFVLGLTLCKEEKFEEAIIELNKSLLMNPSHKEAFYNRGMAKFKLRNFLDAIQDFDQAIDIAPKDADIYSQRGVAKHLMGNSALAMKDMDIAQLLEPQNPYRYTSRAFVRAKMGDLFGAVDDYKVALELDPEDSIAWNNLGLLEEGMGYNKSAKERFKKADGIADQGKDFEKPDLDRILKEAKERNQSEKIELSQKVQNMVQSEEKEKRVGEKPEMTARYYFQTIKDVFTSKETFSDFLSFLKGKKE